MNWEWVVPVIVLVVWILTHVIRPADEPPAQLAAPEPLEDGEEVAKKPASEVDRFLEEINRMRRKQAEEQGQAPPPPPKPRREDIPTVESVEVIPVVIPARQPAAKQRGRRAAPPVAAKPAPARPVASPPLLLPTRPDAAPMPSPAVNLQAMLRSRDAIRNAILLHEVLSPPVSRRRR